MLPMNNKYQKYRVITAFVLIVLCMVIILSEAFLVKDKDACGKIPTGAVLLEADIVGVYGDADAIVTIISDDGDYVTSINLYRLMKERGIKCTVAGVISTISEHINVWDKYVGEGVIDLVSHSYDHIPMGENSEISGDYYELKHQIADADLFLEKRYKSEQICFVCPENVMCSKGYDVLKAAGILAVRGDYEGFNSLSPQSGTEPGQWFNLYGMPIKGDGVTASVRDGWVNRAETQRSWLIEMWHDVRKEDDGRFQTITVEEAAGHLDYIASEKRDGRIWVATYTEAVKYILERQNSKVTAYVDNDRLTVYCELTNDNMSYETFNQPLTVSVKLPDNYEPLVGINNRVDDGCLYVDIMPGEKVNIDLIITG